MVIAMLIQGGMFVIEEAYFRKYTVTSTQTVGFEGVFGSFMYLPILLLSQFIPCSNKIICPDGKLDNISILNS